MAKSVKAKDIEQVIRGYLQEQGCALSVPKKRGQTGVDIAARRGEYTWLIEVIGFQDHPPTRSREFYEGFFRVISRDRGNPNDILVLGLPLRFRNGMKQRKLHYGVAWDKIGKAFPNLKIWYVDTEHKTVKEYPWHCPSD